MFSPLAQGVLTDKYLDGIPEGSRAAGAARCPRDEITDDVLRPCAALNEIAQPRGQSLAQMALAWVLRDPRVTSALVGASSVAQLEDNVAALQRLDFTAEELAAIDRLAPRGVGVPLSGAAVRLVALDVDGTVLPPDHVVAPSTIAAVAAARDAGVHVVLASSRGPVALEPIQDALGLRDEWFIGYQGALVARTCDGGLHVLSELRIDPAAAREAEDRAVAAGLSVGRYVGPRLRVRELTPAMRLEASQTGEHLVVSTPEEADDDDPPHKLMVIADGDGQMAALTALAGTLPDTVTATMSHPGFLEVTARGVDKASGIAPLATELGLPLEAIAAVGDGPNDLGLFAAVGFPIAMGQARPEVRAAARWVTTAVTDDGVARALTHLGAVTEDAWLP